MLIVRSGLDSRHTLIVCGPSDGKEVKDVLGRPVTLVGLGSEYKRPLAAPGIEAWQQD